MFGSHLSIAGGMQLALLEAEKLGLDTVQVFTKNQQQWKCKPLDAEAIKLWKTELHRLKFKKTVSHVSYLINVGSPDETLWRKSTDLLAEELRRCDQLEIPYMVMHPGAHVGSGEAAGLKRIAAGLDMVHKAVPSKTVFTCLEITAGQGSSLGCKLEHLAEIISLVKDPERTGVCLDTAHLFAAGYDFRGDKYADFRKQLARHLGLKRVKVLHLNDSKKELGSRVDRHDHIGAGKIGLTGFEPIVNDSAFAAIPKILETPKGDGPEKQPWDTINLNALRALIAAR